MTMKLTIVHKKNNISTFYLHTGALISLLLLTIVRISIHHEAQISTNPGK